MGSEARASGRMHGHPQPPLSSPTFRSSGASPSFPGLRLSFLSPISKSDAVCIGAGCKSDTCVPRHSPLHNKRGGGGRAGRPAPSLQQGKLCRQQRQQWPRMARAPSALVWTEWWLPELMSDWVPSSLRAQLHSVPQTQPTSVLWSTRASCLSGAAHKSRR